MCSAIDTSIHRRGTLDGQRYLSLGRKAKRDGSCTQNAAEERSCSDSYRFRHCDLLSKPPHKIMTPHVELPLTHVKNTAGADRGQDRCQAAKAKSGKRFWHGPFRQNRSIVYPAVYPRRFSHPEKLQKCLRHRRNCKKSPTYPRKQTLH